MQFTGTPSDTKFGRDTFIGFRDETCGQIGFYLPILHSFYTLDTTLTHLNVSLFTEERLKVFFCA
jgi:hypothetical protein